MRPRYRRSDYVRALRVVISAELKKHGRTKADLAFNVLHTKHQQLLSRRLSGVSAWNIEELDAVAAYFGMTMLEFWVEVEIALTWCDLDNVTNPMVG